MTYSSAHSPAKGYGVTAVLGPTNTGKTHLALERMTSHGSGLIGLPLRLLAREVYNKLCDRVGHAKVSLITGEEKISPPGAKFEVCTVEAMPDDTDAEFVAIDEVQLAAALERGHFFTDRILNLRGRHETMLLGSDTMSDVLRELLPGLNIITRPRMSVLSWAGSKKITRMPSRTAIVAFSTDEVYAIAELVRRERGGTAVVTGSLSPRTRNAQVELYQSGDVDFLVATDAIGMGLNLDVNHVAFAQDAKFDGFQHRKLTAIELAQVAGRAGRYKKDGTFGVTSRVTPFADELIEALETSQFAPVKTLTWRNRDLDFSTIATLQNSLEEPATHPKLMKAPSGTDVVALDRLVRNAEIHDMASTSDMVRLLWDVAKTPDYRKISPAMHSEILAEVYTGIAKDGFVREDWFAELVARADNTGGEIDALSARIANIRTCTYIANRDNWLENPVEWREKSREVEDRLSDALHETPTKRFIDKRTSLLMKRLKENRMLEAEISSDGTVNVEGHKVGSILGFRFTPDSSGGGKEAKALTAAASKVLAAEIEKRAERLTACPNSDIILSGDATLRWIGQPVAKLAAGETPLKPRLILLADEQLTGSHLDKVAARLNRWVANHINTLLKPMSDLQDNTELNGIARGIAFQLVERLGSINRREIADELKSLDQDMRASMRRNGVRFGAYHVFVPMLLKPAPSELICLLWAVANDKTEMAGMSEVPGMTAAGRTSFPYEENWEREFYRLCGFRILGNKAVRIDILERLADLIRPATSWKPDSGTQKPEGAFDGRSFHVTPAMMSILGATHEDMETILTGLGYKSEAKPAEEVRPDLAQKSSARSQENEATIAPGDDAEDKGEAKAGQQTAGEAVVSSAEPSENQENAEGGDEAANETPPGEKATPTEEADQGPKTILVWHFAGTKRPRNSNRFKAGGKPTRNKSSKQHTGGASKHADKGRKPHDTKPRNPKPKNSRLDPNSPFAALAALKDQMKSSDG